MLKNKRGWIRVVEATIAVLIIAGALLLVIERGYIGGTDITSEIYETEISILREIQLDDSLRDEILSIDETDLPMDWYNSSFPANVESRILLKIPVFLGCEAQICELDKGCSLNKFVEKDVYAKSVAIIATTDQQKFYQLKLFCWRKN